MNDQAPAMAPQDGEPFDPQGDPLAESARSMGLAIELAACASHAEVIELVTGYLRNDSVAKHYARIAKAYARRERAA